MNKLFANPGCLVSLRHNDWAVWLPGSDAPSRITPDELRETIVQLARYAGYPNVADFVGITEQIIGEYNASTSEA